MNPIYPKLAESIQVLELNIPNISSRRKSQLEELAIFIAAQLTKNTSADLIFICTHNSRRSHLAQIWMALFAYHYKLNIKAYSGGTEATEFNRHAIHALEDLGFISEKGNGENSITRIGFSNEKQINCFSKKYNHASNPQTHFIAIMTCSQADETCPYISGAANRIALEYEDPKISDGSGNELMVYSKIAMQIGTEILYLNQYLKTQING